jgi:hypothetical protein
MAKRSTGIVARIAALEKTIAGMFSRTATAKKSKRKKTKVKKAKSTKTKAKKTKRTKNKAKKTKTTARAASAKATAKKKRKTVSKPVLILPVDQPVLMGESLLAIPTGQL